MRRSRPCALVVVAAALVLLLPQVAPGQRSSDAAGDEEARAERVEGGAPEEPTPDDLSFQIMLETQKAAQEDQEAACEATEAAFSSKIDKMQEKKEATQEQQEEERDAAWSNVGVQAAGATTAVGAAAVGAEPDEDED